MARHRSSHPLDKTLSRRMFKRPTAVRYEVAVKRRLRPRVMRNVYQVRGKKYVIGVAIVAGRSCVSITWARMVWAG